MSPSLIVESKSTVAWRIRRLLMLSARANLLLAVSVAASTWTVQVVAGLRAEPVAPLAMGLVYYAIYAMDRAVDHGADELTHAERAGFSRRNARILWTTALAAYAVALGLAAPRGVGSIAAVCIPLAAVLLYSFPVVPPALAGRIGFSRVKEVFVLKNVWVAGTQAASVPLIAASAGGEVADPTVLVAAAAFLFGRWWINTVFFDVRDEAGDRANGLRTVPVVLGGARTLRLLHLGNAVLGAACLAAPAAGMVDRRFALLAASSVYGAWYLWRMQRGDDPHFLCDVVADGELAVQAGVVALAMA
jgi:4-hydroxybenzoate polyprenyltransferase